jgi:trimeric autotransporter adhesin
MDSGVCAGDHAVSSTFLAAATAGGSQFVLTVNGDDFLHDSVVKWNGSPLVTTFGSSHQLLTAVTTADIAQPGTVLVFVFNPRMAARPFPVLSE